MKGCLPFLLLLLGANTTWADFSNAEFTYHPLVLEANEPFVIDVEGEWPTDCHPGEQRPVISEYTGNTVLIEFETIVEHVTCNKVATPYRILVDMSDVAGSVEGEFHRVEVTIRFDGQDMVEDVPSICLQLCDPPLQPRDIRPESGLYNSDDLDKQGLLLARQNQRMAANILSYDEAGSSEWLFGAGGIVEDTFFVDLYESKGGQCLDCPAPVEPPQMEAVGKLTMLMDSEGVVQVKVNDGLFVAYEQPEFGYGSYVMGGYPSNRIPDLSGRWAFVEDYVWTPLTEVEGMNTTLIPLVFDIELVSVDIIDPPVVPIPAPPASAMFTVNDKAGNEMAKMKCDFESTWGIPGALENTTLPCSVYNEDINDGENIYQVTMLSLERLEFSYVGPVLSAGGPPPVLIAVRID